MKFFNKISYLLFLSSTTILIGSAGPSSIDASANTKPAAKEYPIFLGAQNAIFAGHACATQEGDCHDCCIRKGIENRYMHICVETCKKEKARLFDEK